MKPHPELWTAVIPAAGRARRLRSPLPKILYPLLGRPILHWIVERLRPFCGSFVFVLSPESRAAVEPVLHNELKEAFRIVIQQEPQGMADAVLTARPAVASAHCMVLWGDQILLRRQTVADCAARHENRPRAKLTFPTVLRDHPYIHFTRNAQGRITGVTEAREQAMPVERGENDCGLFLFQSSALFEVLERNQDNPLYRGKKTAEYNLLPLIPVFDQAPGDVETVRLQQIEESFGINSPDDAHVVEEQLRRRKKETGSYD